MPTGARPVIAAALTPTTLRFVVVGVTAALVLFLLNWALQGLGVAAALASPLSYAVAVALGYGLQRGWAFRSRAGHARSLPRYLAVQGGCALLASGLSAVMAGVPAISPVWNAFLVMLLCSLVSFVATSRWVFPEAGRAS